MKSFFLAICLFVLGYGGYRVLFHHSLVDNPLPSILSPALSPSATPATNAAPVIAWVPPAVLPAQPNWTWTTTDGKVYHDVKIVRIDAACVTIMHADGGGRVPLSTLPTDMQKYFNYNPAAAAKADEDFQSGVKEEQAAAAKAQQEADQQKASLAAATKGPDFYRVTDNYASAVTQAKAANKLLLLHFTGSDWCPACKTMEDTIINTTTFQAFSGANFVMVTLDQPHNSQLSSELEQQNATMSQKYNVRAVPTLIVTNLDGAELARTEGCPDGTATLIAELKRQLTK